MRIWDFVYFILLSNLTYYLKKKKIQSPVQKRLYIQNGVTISEKFMP